MRVLALIGLVAIEKIHLAVELASHFTASGKSVTVIDNGARIWLDPVNLGGEPLVRINGDITTQLREHLVRVGGSDIVIALISEAVNFEKLIDTLDEVQYTGIDLTTLGLIDLRTCDCFPQTRQLIEHTADIVVNMPYNIEDILEKL